MAQSDTDHTPQCWTLYFHVCVSRLSLYLSEDGVKFALPQLGALETQLCVTWESSSGATSFFLNGRRSLTKIYSKDHVIQPGGKVILGQDLDSGDGSYHASQSFVGEISEVNMWDFVLSASSIQDLYSRRTVQSGNVFNWESTELKVSGDVDVITHEL